MAGQGVSRPSFRAEATRWMAGLHDEITTYFEGLDGAGQFREDSWERPGGGGGHARVLTNGALFEKAGINRSAVDGVLPPGAATRLGAAIAPGTTPHFFATGVSLVLHPHSPRVPTVHLNVRFFEMHNEHGDVLDSWFGGGTDLTPFYPDAEACVQFHGALKTIADRHHPTFYPRFKRWCDEYFVNGHRQDERRGIGGIFFDNLRPGDASGLEQPALHAFVHEVGASLPHAYGPIVARTRDLPFTDEERHFQLVRRGRYVEFNLVHDRGTTFGLQTNARIESVLMSLPPLAAWDYDPQYAPGSFQAELTAMLEPRDWV